MVRHFRTDADALEAALEKGAESGSNAPLVALAAELRRAGAAIPTPVVSRARREELRLTVLARAAERHPAGTIARVRGATFSIAAVAGAGLVVASAASGSNPAMLVVDAARELPRIANHAAPPANFALEGEVIASRDGGKTLEVRTANETILVESPREQRSVTNDGTPVAAADIREGANVRVTGREPDAGIVNAKTIEVLPSPPAAAGSRPEPTLRAQSNAGPKPTNVASLAGSNATPRPANTPKPATQPPPANTITVALAPVAPLIPTRTPTPTPTATPTANTTLPRSKPEPTAALPAPTDPDPGNQPAPANNDTQSDNLGKSTD